MTYRDYTSRRKFVYGIGVNDADYVVSPKVNGKQQSCKYYSTWKAMLKRCYSDEYIKRNPTYKDCSVDERWHSFMAFRAWMETQDWKGKELDKDVIYPGNREYSQDACVFVSRDINALLNSRSLLRGKYPQGVSTQHGKFCAGVSISGGTHYLGIYKTEGDASNAYRNAKRLHILKIACCEPDIRVKQGLYRHSELLR